MTDAVTGLPIEGIRLDVYDLSQNYMGWAQTNVNGYYEFTEFASGSYRIHFGGDADHLEEWHHDAASFGAATTLTVTNNGITTANESLAPYGTLSGTVTDAVTGLPIEGAWVNLYDSSGNHKGSTGTNVNGYYKFEDLAPGSYRVRFDCGNYSFEWHHNAATFGTATAVTVNPGATTTVNEDLVYANGTLSGTVTDAVTGLPIEGIAVEIYDLSQNWLGYGHTDPNGYYEFTEFASGSYRIHIGGDADHREEWHHDAASFGSAATVTVTSKGITTANESLTPYGTLVGTVTDAVTGLPIESAGVNLYDANGNHLGVHKHQHQRLLRVRGPRSRQLPGAVRWWQLPARVVSQHHDLHHRHRGDHQSRGHHHRQRVPGLCQRHPTRHGDRRGHRPTHRGHRA